MEVMKIFSLKTLYERERDCFIVEQIQENSHQASKKC